MAVTTSYQDNEKAPSFGGAASRLRFEVFRTQSFSAAVIVLAASYPIVLLTYYGPQ